MRIASFLKRLLPIGAPFLIMVVMLYPALPPVKEAHATLPANELWRENLVNQVVGFGKNTTGGKGGTLCTVTNLNDSGAGSLWACAEAGGTSWIVFAVNGTIQLNSMLYPLSNKTIDGRGADITLTKCGIEVGANYHPKPHAVNNLIIKNLKFEDMTIHGSETGSNGLGCAGMLIIAEDASNIWADHLTFHDSEDEMIYVSSNGSDGSTGAPPTNVTVSWSRFDFSDRNIVLGDSDCIFNGHPSWCDKSFLVSDPSLPVDDGITLTIHHNWFNKTHVRNPYTRWATIHSFNNYHDHNEITMQAEVGTNYFSENDIFDGSTGYPKVKVITTGSPCSGASCTVKVTGPWSVTGSEVYEQLNAGSSFNPASSYSYTPATADATLRTSITTNAGWKNVTAPSPTPTPTSTPTPTPTPVVCTPVPYTGTAVSLPGTVQIENYDACSSGANGEGTTYHDLDAANQGGAFRTSEGVDILSTSDTGGGYKVGYTRAGEWLTYTVNVPTPGNYTLSARVASQGAGGAFHIEFNGVNKTGTMMVPDTGSWSTYTTVSVPVTLSAGTQVMRMVLDSDSAIPNISDFNYIQITTAPTPTPTPSPVACSQYTPSSTIPTGYASPYDVVSSPSTNLMNVTCLNLTDARLDLGKGDPLQYIYNQGYLFKTGGTNWTPLSYTSSESLIAGAWYPKAANTTISLTGTELSQPSYALAYLCTWIGSGWKCGCRDSACMQSYWQIQSFKR